MDLEILFQNIRLTFINPIALRKAKIVGNFGLSDFNRVKGTVVTLCDIMGMDPFHAVPKFYIV